MAYEAKNLSVLAYANGFTLWHYKSDDTLSSAKGSGYFNKASDMVRVGDMVFVNGDVDNASRTSQDKVLVVVRNSSSGVTTAEV